VATRLHPPVQQLQANNIIPDSTSQPLIPAIPINEVTVQARTSTSTPPYIDAEGVTRGTSPSSAVSAVGGSPPPPYISRRLFHQFHGAGAAERQVVNNRICLQATAQRRPPIAIPSVIQLTCEIFYRCYEDDADTEGSWTTIGHSFRVLVPNRQMSRYEAYWALEEALTDADLKASREANYHLSRQDRCTCNQGAIEEGAPVLHFPGLERRHILRY